MPPLSIFKGSESSHSTKKSNKREKRKMLKRRKQVKKRLTGSALFILGLLLGSSLSVVDQKSNQGFRNETNQDLLNSAYISEITVSGGNSLKPLLNTSRDPPAPKDGTFTGIYQLELSTLFLSCIPGKSGFPRW